VTSVTVDYDKKTATVQAKGVKSEDLVKAVTGAGKYTAAVQ
jgi:copper chaperone CopZ